MKKTNEERQSSKQIAKEVNSLEADCHRSKQQRDPDKELLSARAIL